MSKESNKQNGHEMYARLETITRERVQAEVDAGKIQFNIRAFSERWCESLVQQMKGRIWHSNSQTIAYKPDGTLCDGQHRMEAIRRSGVPQKLWVIYNCPTSDGIDIGRKRTFGDLLGGRQIANSLNVASVVRCILVMNKGQDPWVGAKVHIPNEELMHFYEQLDPERVQKAIRDSGRFRHINRNVAATFLFFANPAMKQTQDFWEALATVKGLQAGNPVLCLHQYLISRRKQKLAGFRKGYSLDFVACVYAWELWKKRRLCASANALSRAINSMEIAAPTEAEW